MTVSYQYDVASSTSGGFTRLLFKWKGSVYKLVWRELAWFMFAFALLSVLYRNIDGEYKKIFERVVYYFDSFLSLIPLSFVLGVYVTLVVTRWWQQFLAIPWPDKIFEKLVMACDGVLNLIPLTFVTGFYVSFVATRWWQQYMAIPWPDRIAHCLALYISGNDEHSRVIRRTLARYLNLSLILVLRSISMAVKKRFPTLQHLVEGGFMTKTELEIYQSVPSSEFNTYWIPCTWFINLIKEARRAKLITDSQGLKLLVEEFNEFRSKCGLLWSYDWVSIPLVYTQVVTLATYSFFAACVVGRQYVELPDIEQNKNRVDLYVPISTILQFFFYMGLLKVAEALINPFGDDDEDFELNWMIDRHLKVCYLVVDTLLCRNPPLVKDQHYDDPEPTLAYTKAAMMYKKKTFRGSVAAVHVPEEDQTMFLPEILEEDEDNADFNSDLSINKHSSNSIMNLRAWASSTGSRILHTKKDCEQPTSHQLEQPTSEQYLKTSRSMSVTEDIITMDAAGGHLGLMPRQSSPRPRLQTVTAAAQRQTATNLTFTSGIRRFFSTTVARSTESIPFTRVVTHHLPQAQRPNVTTTVKRDESFSARSDAGVVTISPPDPQPPELDVTDPDAIAASRLKSRSLDMGAVPPSSAASTSSSVVAMTGAELCLPQARNRSGSCVPKLRDLKRKKRKKKSDPKHVRTWRSKESLPIGDDIEIHAATPPPASARQRPRRHHYQEYQQQSQQLQRTTTTTAADHDDLQVPGISLSLPSLHLWPVPANSSSASSSNSTSTILQIDDHDEHEHDFSISHSSASGAQEADQEAALMDDQDDDDFVDADANQSPESWSRFLRHCPATADMATWTDSDNGLIASSKSPATTTTSSSPSTAQHHQQSDNNQQQQQQHQQQQQQEQVTGRTRPPDLKRVNSAKTYQRPV